MVNKYVFIFLTLLLSASLVFSATTGKISGKVVDAETGEALPGVNVIIQGTQMGAATDAGGEYFIINVPPGTYELMASMIGYAKLTKTNVRVKIDQTTPLDFNLQKETIAGEEVTVVAERPVVEVDLTASKQTMSADEMAQSWVNTVEDAVQVQSGVGIRGTIRGGFAINAAYVMDGVDMRDAGTSSSFVVTNTSAIQEMEVLTGGFNAEYGQAQDAVVNIVTKSARQNWHGSFKTRFRPAGKYHWGRNIYSKENVEYWAINRQFFDTFQPGGRWDEYWETKEGITPDADFNWQKWQQFTTPPDYQADYADLDQWEFEGVLYGPITSKLDLMLSARHMNSVTKFPSPLTYSPEWNVMGKLNYALTTNTKLAVTFTWQGTDNSGKPKLTYHTGDDLGQSAGGAVSPEVRTPYDSRKWSNNSRNVMHTWDRSPQYIRQYIGSIKLTHTFNPSTFLEFQINHNQLQYKMNYDGIYDGYTWADWIEGRESGDPLYWEPLNFTPNPVSTVSSIRFQPTDIARMYAYNKATSIKADFTSQINNVHLLKAGASFSPQYVDSWVGGAFAVGAQPFNKVPNREYTPWDASVYVQDKIEVKGMIVNLGLRVDMFHVGKKVSDTLWDPYQLYEKTPGNIGGGLLSFDPDGEHAVNPDIQVAVSPRIGISHPITETTVLHFMYGHFNNRPPWSYVGGNKVIWDKPGSVGLPPDYIYDPNEAYNYLHWMGRGGNPRIGYEKQIQYEVGFDQDIAGLLNLDVTMYYKDAEDLSRTGFRLGEYNYGNTGTRQVELRMHQEAPTKQTPQENYTNRGSWAIQGGRLDARGLEFKAETRFFRYAQVRVIYDMSYSNTGQYGPWRLFFPIPQEDGSIKKLGRDRYVGGGENQNEVWNPHNTIKVNAQFSTPLEFGPAVANFYPLGDWLLNVYHSWASGQQYTYYSPDYSGVKRPLNMSWDAFNKTNLRLSKGFKLTSGIRAELSLDVINLFDAKQYKLFGGNDRIEWHENGRLPIVSASYLLPDGSTEKYTEENQWTVYRPDLLPREIFFGLSLEF